MKLDFNLDRKNVSTGIAAAAVALVVYAINLNPALLEWFTDAEKVDKLARAVAGGGTILAALLGVVSGNLPKGDA